MSQMSTITVEEQTSTNKGRAYAAKAYAAQSDASGLAPAAIRRREPGPNDVQIDVLFCGVCHSDLHQVRNEWEQMMPTVYPCVPGHEIVGRVVKAGIAVKKFRVGDLAAWDVWSIPTVSVRTAARAMSNSATALPLLPTTRRTTILAE
jgi:uncharacterized zinc-type alcohol dehydrogenase-like protein